MSKEVYPIIEIREIKTYCTNQFQISITLGRVNSFVLPQSGEVTQIKRSPKKEQHLRVSRGFLEKTIQDLNQHG
jgi:hypothetical protein